MKPYVLPDRRPAWCLAEDDARAMEGRLWKEGVYDAFGLSLRPGGTVVDAGANIGFFTRWLWHRVEAQAHVHLLEPLAELAAVAARNVAGTLGSATVHTLGLSDREEVSELRFHPAFPMWSSRCVAMDEARAAEMRDAAAAMVDKVYERVAVESGWKARALQQALRLTPRSLWAQRLRDKLDTYQRYELRSARFVTLSHVWETIGASSWDLLKVDVEGDELAVLRGLDDQHWPHVAQVVGEVDEGVAAVQRVADFLRQRGYEVRWEEVRVAGVRYPEVGVLHHVPYTFFAARPR